ncbi:MAG: tetratricopeptide repeat protein [Bacteroidales bacterium]|nr:tetratricopeptide repeat protein [Bacteroidales bacterium]
MKNVYKYCLIALLPLLTVACGQREVTDDMPDSIKLQLLDINIERDPDNAELLAARARVLFNLQRLQEAGFDISQALKSDPKNLEYLLLKSDIAFAGGNIEDSYRTLTEAEGIDPSNQDVLLKLGELTFYSRDYDRSLKYLSQVTERDPNSRTALFMKGFIYKEKGDTANAVQFFRRVCDKFPDYSPAFEQLGVLYASVNNPMAVEYLTTALNLDPSNTNSMYALALYYQERQELEPAETLYHQILDLNPNSADAWHNLGYIELFSYRDYARAIEYFTHAVEANSQYIEAYVNRGCAYELSGNAAMARADFENALAINNTYQPALEGLKRIK